MNGSGKEPHRPSRKSPAKRAGAIDAKKLQFCNNLRREDLAVLEAYRQHVAERAALGISPLPLSAKQTEELIGLLKTPPAGEEQFLVDLVTYESIRNRG